MPRLQILAAPLVLALLLAPAAPAGEGPAERTPRQNLIQEIMLAMQAGDIPKALAARDVARKALAEAEAEDPKWVGYLRLYEALALYRAKRWADAYAAILGDERLPYTLAPANQAYLASLCAELCMYLGKPVEEILRHGTAAAEKRREAGDPQMALVAANNTLNILSLHDAEHVGEPLARRLIAGGREAKDPAWVVEGYEHLVNGAYRAGKLSDLPQLGKQLVRDLDGLPPRSDLDPRLRDLLVRLKGSNPPPSHRAELEARRAKGK